MNRILRFALSLKRAVVEPVRIDGDRVVVRVRPWKAHGLRCPKCGRRCECHDASAAPRLWRATGLARSMCFPGYRTRRVRCPEHGVLVERVPWARHGARSARDFEDWVACLAVRCTASAVTQLARIEWHSVGGICARACADLEAARGKGRFDGIRRIGIDETSYRKGRKHLTVVAGHDRGCLIWAHEGYGKDVPDLFPGGLTREQRRGVEVAAADGAKWIKALVRRRCPNARRATGPFHAVGWTSDALDTVRREEWRVAKEAAREAAPKRNGPGRPRRGEETPPEAKALEDAADAIRNSRCALAKNPEDLTDAQRAKLESIKKKAGSRLFRAWELKEDLRAVLGAASAQEASGLPGAWPRDAAYCRIKPVVAVEKKVRRRRADVVAAVGLGIGNGRAEAVNNKIKGHRGGGLRLPQRGQPRRAPHAPPLRLQAADSGTAREAAEASGKGRLDGFPTTETTEASIKVAKHSPAT